MHRTKDAKADAQDRLTKTAAANNGGEIFEVELINWDCKCYFFWAPIDPCKCSPLFSSVQAGSAVAQAVEDKLLMVQCGDQTAKSTKRLAHLYKLEKKIN